MQYKEVKEYIRNKLGLLNENLTYHCVWHTLNDVLPAAIYLANKLNIKGDELVMLKTAVLFHDIGYLYQYEGNEFVGAKVAEEILPQYDYKEHHIEIIKKLIFVTQFPQTPSTLLEKIVCDADLDSLHRDNFIELGEKLRKELSFYRDSISRNEWMKIQLKFIKNHSYHTNVNRELRNTNILKNIKLIEDRLVVE